MEKFETPRQFTERLKNVTEKKKENVRKNKFLASPQILVEKLVAIYGNRIE